MTVAELIDVLQSYDQGSEILISDGMNRYEIQYETITEMDLDVNHEPTYDEETPTESFVVLGEDY